MLLVAVHGVTQNILDFENNIFVWSSSKCNPKLMPCGQVKNISELSYSHDLVHVARSIVLGYHSIPKLNGDHFGVDVKKNGDHFGVDLGMISGLGIISGSGSFRGLYKPQKQGFTDWTEIFGKINFQTTGNVWAVCCLKENNWKMRFSLRKLFNTCLIPLTKD